MKTAKEFMREKIKTDFNTNRLVEKLDAIYQEVLINAMNQFAMQNSCEFAEWLTDNFYTVDSNFYWYDCRKETPEIVLYKTNELYEQFIAIARTQNK